MEVFDRQQVFGTRLHPIASCWSLTLWAVPVFAGIVSDVPALTHARHVLPSSGMIAFGTRSHMPAKRLGPASLNGRHDFELVEADMPGIGPPPRGAVSSEDARDFKLWAVTSLSRLATMRGGQIPRPSLWRSCHIRSLQLRQRLKRTDCVADRFGRHVGILRRGRQFGMPQEHLNDPDVRIRL